ncbi:conserved hypothetical protein [Mesorhizobium ventifaucium]|uniref:Uncharacterized protein n=1 Tax=Mesorhizobium ventifaucium TaxID=666020 RepID=A0ABM9DKM9_9HYPH|nr:conserved hypothetical protein [Mesorhizobium ventifaucium]
MKEGRRDGGARHPSAHAATGLLPAPRPLEFRRQCPLSTLHSRHRKPDRIAEQIGKAVKRRKTTQATKEKSA